MAQFPKLQEFRKPALALVSLLAKILSSPDSKEIRELRATRLIEQQLIVPTTDNARRYLGCLMKAYVHYFTQDTQPISETTITAKLDALIKGDFEVQGEPKNPKNLQIEAIQNNERLRETETPAITTNSANYWALMEIMRMEMAREFGNETIAKHLAASTAYLRCNQNAAHIAEVEQAFCDAVNAHQCNPFKEATIFEFGGYRSALATPDGKTATPLIKLFKTYTDYTPKRVACISTGDADYISADNPGKFAEMTQRNEKFDYVIASNIFCIGAASGPSSATCGERLLSDLLPHLTHALKDEGKLVVSNVSVDGLDLPIVAQEQEVHLNQLGIRQQAQRLPLYTEDESIMAGLSVFTRDYHSDTPLADMMPHSTSKKADGPQRG